METELRPFLSCLSFEAQSSEMFDFCTFSLSVVDWSLPCVSAALVRAWTPGFLRRARRPVGQLAGTLAGARAAPGVQESCVLAASFPVLDRCTTPAAAFGCQWIRGRPRGSAGQHSVAGKGLEIWLHQLLLISGCFKSRDGTVHEKSTIWFWFGSGSGSGLGRNRSPSHWKVKVAWPIRP